MQNNKITIVGAGPAGLSAGIQLAQFGVYSTIIDENNAIGGAIFKQPDKGLESSIFRNEKTFKQAKLLFNEFKEIQHFIELKLNTEVIGNLSTSNELVLSKDNTIETIPNNPLIISTGCYERAQPFPGWTLPGIMSVGGIQLQAKCGHVQPGKNVALVGTGPLLLVAAKQLHMAGVKVVAVVEAGKRRELLGEIKNLLAHSKLLFEGVSYLSYLSKHKIPIYYGHGIVSASGNDSLEELEIAPYNNKWEPILDKSFKLKVDGAGIGYGYVPRIQLTQMLECTHDYNTNVGGFYPVVDEWRQTSIKGVYTAGDNSGVYGSEVAMLDGKIAAIGYLKNSQKITSEQANKMVRPILHKKNKLKQFQNAFNGFSKLKAGLLELPQDNTIICRCENVDKHSIDEAIKTGVENLNALKIKTRVGMGDCQGKMCGSFCNEYLAKQLDCTNLEAGSLKPRFPLSPISFETLINDSKIVDCV